MGCVHGKRTTTNSPNKGSLQKLKLENAYVRVGNAGRGARYLHGGAAKAAVDTGGGRGRGGEKGICRESGKGTVSQGISVKKNGADEMVDGWPQWLIDNIPSDALAGLFPKSADSYDKLAKVGQGTYSNVYKARDKSTGKIVALKKVRFDTSEPQSVKFMAREIIVLKKLDHPNIIKLEGIATSRMQYSLYLVFDFMPSDLTKLISPTEGRLTEPQVKSYMQQLLSGLQHCHEKGILHRDIKGSNLLIDKDGLLKIADFGLANFYQEKEKRPLTSRVVTLWYRAPELLLGSTDYGVGIDLWSAGCILAEMFVGRPIMPGRNEEMKYLVEAEVAELSTGCFTSKAPTAGYQIKMTKNESKRIKIGITYRTKNIIFQKLDDDDEDHKLQSNGDFKTFCLLQIEQLHKIFKLCGAPSEEYWSKVKPPATFRPPQQYKPNFEETFPFFPRSIFGLLGSLLALDPTNRGAATSALQSEFFTTSPLPCDISGLPMISTGKNKSVQSTDRRRVLNTKQRSQNSLGSHKRKVSFPDLVAYAKQDIYTSESQSQETSKSSSSTSSITKRSTIQEIPPGSPTPAFRSLQLNRSAKTEAHPNALKNIKNYPLLLASLTEAANHLKESNSSLYRRSLSHIDFRNLDLEKISKLISLEDH